ncbi:ATPase family 2 protein [Taenia crassiceps]|uniref:ATPase family 2 protein n=1 Tax=Taenia crassiceps TaxID=6207 RepID=A0ABR4QS47_9CEST
MSNKKSTWSGHPASALHSVVSRLGAGGAVASEYPQKALHYSMIEMNWLGRAPMGRGSKRRATNYSFSQRFTGRRYVICKCKSRFPTTLLSRPILQRLLLLSTFLGQGDLRAMPVARHHGKCRANRSDVRNVETFVWSLLLRLQSCYVLPGTTECFKILGCETLVHFLAVASPSGRERDEAFSVDQWMAEHPFTFITEYYDQNEFVNFDSFSFCNVESDRTVYKVSLDTQIRMLHHHGMLVRVPWNLTKKHNLDNPPIGLESTVRLVVEFIRHFSLSTKVLPNAVEPTGLLLYGLQGCGKSRVLEMISCGDTAYDAGGMEPLRCHEWYRHLHFVTLSMDDYAISESEASSTSVRKYIDRKLVDIPCSCSGVVLSLPNLDTWFSAIQSAHAAQVDEQYEVEVLSRNTSLLSFLFTTLKRVCAIAPVCVLATSTDSAEILKNRDFRNLFYRRLLVSLPSGEQRFRLLAEEMRRYTSQLNVDCKELLVSAGSSGDCDRLYQLAASLHGYTVADISRLFRACYAAAIDECVQLGVKLKEGDQAYTPTFAQILDKLEAERSHYSPVNLCAEISVFPPMRWSDIGGYAEIKRLFISTIQQRLIEAADPTGEAAQTNKCLGLVVPRGVLLHGPPGCSKTLFVRALATECNLPLVAVQASRIFGRYVGDSERNMQRILVHARACAPAILFIDEIDLLLPSRSSSESGVSEHVLGEVLTAMDGVEGQCGQLLLIAATNRVENLDPALRRAGRFDVSIYVPPPDAEARMAILHLELTKRSTSKRALESHWLEVFAKDQLEGYTGAEVVGVVQVAAELTRESGKVEIDREHLLLARERLPPSTLEQYHVHPLREAPQIPPSPSPLPTSPSGLSSHQYVVISSILIVLFAVGWQLIMHFGVDCFPWLYLPQ